MSENHEFTNSDLFRDLSEQEQETITAGHDLNPYAETNFFIQKTDIQNSAENQTNIPGYGYLSTQKTGYHFSQITMSATIKYALPSGIEGQNTSPDFLATYFNRLFS